MTDIKIKKIEVNSCGPISSLNEDIFPLTLFYAPNESGKTTIVENIAASLFKGASARGDRDFVGASRVTLSGLSAKPSLFSPFDKKNKLDALPGVNGNRYPAGLFNLLYVTGAETALIKERGGVSRTVLKGLLSKQNVYEEVKKKIPGEVGYTGLSRGVVVAQKRMGRFKSYDENRIRLEKINEISDLFHESLSRTRLVRLYKKRSSVAARIEDMKRAKRHLAWKLAVSIEKLRDDLDNEDESHVRRLDDLVREFFHKKKDLRNRQEKLKQFRGLDENVRWLEKAGNEYINCLNSSRNIYGTIFFSASFLFLLSAVFAFFRAGEFILPLIGLSFASLMAAFLFYFVIKKAYTPESSRIIIDQISGEYNRRFNRQLHTAADFEVMKSGLEQKIGEMRSIRGLAEELEHDLAKLGSEITRGLKLMGIADAGEERWGQIIKKLNGRIIQNSRKMSEQRARLDSLSIDRSDYFKDGPAVDYSAEGMNELRRLDGDLQRQIDDEEGKFESIRRSMSEYIGADTAFSESLENISLELNKRIREIERLMTGAISTIIAGHILSDVITEFTSEEDEILEELINDRGITSLVKKFTGRYDRLYIEGEDVFVGNQGEAFNLAHMSTGAQEQVLLALRIGIAEKIMGTEKLFLILDDAFQYSDYNRREGLVNRTVTLVEEGWQVLYFTMDDDIRDRFIDSARSLGEGMFRMIEV